jgi:hypothetical protein
VLILGYTTFKSGKKAMASWKAESIAKKQEAGSQELPPVDEESKYRKFSFAVDYEEKDVSNENNPDIGEKVDKLTEIMKEEIRPKKQAVQMVILWIFIIVFALIRGGRTTFSIANIKFCSGSYWFVTVVQFLLLVLFTFLLGMVLYKKSQKKMDLGWLIGKGEILWNKSHLITYPALSFFAGLAGGMLGIGGGMVLGPLFLELGMSNTCTSATSATSVVSIIYILILFLYFRISSLLLHLPPYNT